MVAIYRNAAGRWRSYRRRVILDPVESMGEFSSAFASAFNV